MKSAMASVVCRPPPRKNLMHPALLLWAEHAPSAGYPTGVIPVDEAIQGTAFFPGGYGLWKSSPGTLPDFPIGGTMILGHDFHSEVGYRASLKRGAESESQPTWRNLLALLTEADIAPSECFFTNVFMGLRAGSATTGTFPGAADAIFVAHCRRFLLRQIEMQRPTLILTLGVHAPRMLAPLSTDLAPWAEGKGLRHLDRVGPVRFDVRFSDLPTFRTTVVALVHPSLRPASVRYRRYGTATGADAELLMIRDGRAAKMRPGVDARCCA